MREHTSALPERIGDESVWPVVGDPATPLPRLPSIEAFLG
jgi:hypothetical protein